MARRIDVPSMTKHVTFNTGGLLMYQLCSTTETPIVNMIVLGENDNTFRLVNIKTGRHSITTAISKQDLEECVEVEDIFTAFEIKLKGLAGYRYIEPQKYDIEITEDF